jgi:glycosyltransferase involved in cell wall biosynthesis
MPNPTVRVHLLTYRRPTLLVRALESLRAQTFQDWVCELHNDDPTDAFPAQLVARSCDYRITVVNHPTNLGLVRTFNELFRTVPESYVSVLEDDNTWDPIFLDTMVKLLERHRDVVAAWANLRYRLEQPDGSWLRDGRCIWPTHREEGVRRYYWPSVRQIAGAISSQGAMLWRSSRCANLRIPDTVTPSCMEAFRERLTPHPLLFQPEPLGDYAVTLQTVRAGDTWRYGRDQIAMAGSFFALVPRNRAEIRKAWDACRAGDPYGGHTVLYAALVLPECRFLLRYATWRDWFYFLRAALGRPVRTARMLWSRDNPRSLFRWLLPWTQERFLEGQAHGFTGRLKPMWYEEVATMPLS